MFTKMDNELFLFCMVLRAMIWVADGVWWCLCCCGKRVRVHPEAGALAVSSSSGPPAVSFV